MSVSCQNLRGQALSRSLIHIAQLSSEDHDPFDDTAHNAIDSYGISIPLINFYPHKKRCAGSESPIVERHPYAVTRLVQIRSNLGYEYFLTMPCTRTFLRVVKMTKLYDSKEYHRRQMWLRDQIMVRGIQPSLLNQTLMRR